MFQGSCFFFEGSVFGVFFLGSPFASISVATESASFSGRPLFRAARPMYGEGFDAGGYAAADAAPVVQALLSTARLAQQQLEQDAELRQMPQLITTPVVQGVIAEPQVEVDRKQAAANSIKPGCAQWTIKAWDPKDEKPKKEHLLKAMANRILPPGSKPPAPAGWEVQKIADWLKAHGVEGEVQDVTSPAPQLGVGGSPGEDVSPPTASASGGGAPPPPGVDRWAARSHGCRLITLIGTQDDLREGFLRKDVKFTTRTEKDIGDRDTFYVMLAKAFNDPSCTVELVKVKSQVLAEKLRDKNFTCAHSAYVLSPDVAKKKLVDVIGQLRSALARFRQSGQGNCGSDEKVREAQDQHLEPGVTEEDSKKVYSSDFQNFCAGIELTAYTYEVFMQYQLVEAASGDMPDASTASSEGASTTQRPSCRAGGRNKGKGKEDAIARSIREAATAPMRLERSAHEEEGMRLQNATAKLALKRQVTQDIDDLQTKIDDLEREVRRAKKNGETPPSHKDKLKRWLARIRELEAVAATPPRQGATPRPAEPSVHSLDDSEDEWDDSEEEDGEEGEESL